LFLNCDAHDEGLTLNFFTLWNTYFQPGGVPMRYLTLTTLSLVLLSCVPASGQAPNSPPTQAPVVPPAQAPVVQPSVPGAVPTPTFGYPDISGTWRDEEPVICRGQPHFNKVVAQITVTLISGEASGFIQIKGLSKNIATRFSGHWDAVGANTFTGTTSQGEKLELLFFSSSSINITITVKSPKFYSGMCYESEDPNNDDIIGLTLKRDP
jgi:hypothetical protein